MNQPNTLTEATQDKALALVAAWLGPRMGHNGPAPTGEDAAYNATGPMLVREWSAGSVEDAPTIILEGGPFEWGIEASLDTTLVADLAKIGVFAEPYYSFTLCLFPKD